MGLYTGDPAAWVDQIYQFELTDVIIGGPAGIDNVPLKNLADRTAWLKSQIGIANRLSGETILVGSGAITPAMTGHLIKLISNVPSAVQTCTLDDANTFPPHALLHLVSFAANLTVAKITGGQFYNHLDGNQNELFMHGVEFLTLKQTPGETPGTAFWSVVNAEGNFNCVGEEVKARKILRNTLPMQGQLLSRSLFPRLWKYINDNFPMGAGMVTEIEWFSGINYQGFFSNGDGATNFRLPDERGMFERMLDGGRGVDVSRTINQVGGYEADQIKAHTHGIDIPSMNFDNDASTGPDLGADGSDKRTFTTKSTGGVENIVKNIAKLNLIKF